jgi:hypothetical protein
MALLFNAKHPEECPQLHALIIGVGHYPKLNAAKSAERQLPPLDDLHSPPVSAETLAHWLVDHQTWLDGVKLGTIELLVSRIPHATNRKSGRGSATLAGIISAYDRWFKRCNANPNNIAVFYFCGHGLQKDNMLLLPADFSERSPWAKAIDFDLTYRGMSTCAAKSQYFIIDACRQWTQVMLQDLHTGGVPLGRHDVKQHKLRTAPRLFATAVDLPAFGDTAGKPSRLTDALVACMEGKAAEKVNGRWHIKFQRLGSAVHTMLELGNRLLPEGEQQTADPQIGECAAGDRPLLVLPKGAHPSALVEFACDPTEATEHAHFYHQGIHPPQNECHAKSRGAWSTELLAGYYNCGAKIEQHPRFASGRLEGEPILPPGRPVNVTVPGNARTREDLG